MFERSYKNYVLAFLTAILLFNYVDRIALGVTLQDIKAELHLSDTELGFLTGLAFAMFYAVMGVPLARWADRGNRVSIITITVAIWSVAVALCGAVRAFTQLVAIRIAVAVGEAGCIPPAFSLIADYFKRAERPRALAIYGMGGGLSAVVGYFAAGWLNQYFGWRLTFAVLACPGVVLAVGAWVTIREPRRQGSRIYVDVYQTDDEEAPTALPPIIEVVATLRGIDTFRCLLWCLATMFFFNYGVFQWHPALLMRSYGLSSIEAGMWLSLLCGVGGLIGSLAGGEYSARYAVDDERRQLKFVAIAISSTGMCFLLGCLSHNKAFAFAMFFLSNIGTSTANGPVFSTIQTLVPDRMRATAFSIVYLVSNLVGMGLGPLAVGVLSDGFQRCCGNESLRYALIGVSPGYLLVSWFAWRASRSVTGDLRAARRLVDVPEGATQLMEAGALGNNSQN